MKFTFRPASFVAAAAIAALTTLSSPVFASSEALLDLFKILRDKGTLSSSEYELLVNTAKADDEKTAYTKTEIKQEVAESVAAVEKKTAKLAWAEKIKLKGDLRTRYQYQDEDGSADRSRGRLRYRLGVIAKPAEHWEVGAGLASGGSDQRSTNQSFDASFSTKGINLDYAYMQYDSGFGLTGVAGKFKFKNYLYTPTDVMWDGDINPEGLSLHYGAANSWGEGFANGGILVLEENSSASDDPFMVYGQLGQKWQVNGWSGTVAGAIYGFSDADAVSDFSASEGTNTDAQLGSFNLNGEIGHALGGGKVNLIGEFINNFETDTSTDTAWALGAKYKLGKWAMKYIYADVEANAVPDFLPDSDRFDGLTGIQGHEFEISYALHKQVSLALDFYSVENHATGADQEIVQADLNVKF